MGVWIPRFSRSFNDLEVGVVDRVLSTLQGKRLAAGLEDRVMWKVLKNGIFSVNSLYNSLDPSCTAVIWAFGFLLHFST